MELGENGCDGVEGENRMRFKKFRFWLASKIRGRVIEDKDSFIRAERHKWMHEQLKEGNPVTLTFRVKPEEEVMH